MHTGPRNQQSIKLKYANNQIPNNTILRIGDPHEGFTITGYGMKQLGSAFRVSIADAHPDDRVVSRWIRYPKYTANNSKDDGQDDSSDENEDTLHPHRAHCIASAGPVHVVFRHNLDPQPIDGFAPAIQCVSVSVPDSVSSIGSKHQIRAVTVHSVWLHVLTLFHRNNVAWPCLRPSQLPPPHTHTHTQRPWKLLHCLYGATLHR